MADFVYNGSVVVAADKVALHLEQLEDEGFITCVQSHNPISMHDGRLTDYCRHLNSEIGEDNEFGSTGICTQVGAFLTIYRHDGESKELAEKVINDAADARALAEGRQRDWKKG